MIRYSQLFVSCQGEAHRNGMPTMFFRFFGCNLKCDGFGQADPTNPSSWILPYKEESVIQSFNEGTPVFTHGCDSSFSHYHKFKKYAMAELPDIIAKKMLDMANESGYNTSIGWRHEKTYNPMQLCLTGGEPMLWQKSIMKILECLGNDAPEFYTIETNATQKIDELRNTIRERNIHLSCSPKLYNVSGEKNGIDIDTLQSYIDASNSGSLKFVMNNREESWNELQSVVENLRFRGREGWRVWVMPVGATMESQTEEVISEISDRAIREGYNVAARSHIQLYGNKIGK